MILWKCRLLVYRVSYGYLVKFSEISPESLRKVHNDLVEVQTSCLQRWLGE